METLALFGIAFVGSIIWFVPVSATSVVYGSELGWNPLVVGLVCGLGQSVGYVVLYYAGLALLGRWAWLTRQVDLTRERYGARLDGAYLPTTLLGGVVGMPPMVALATLAPAFQVKLVRFLLVAFVGRVARFAVMAGAGKTLGALLGQ